MFNKKVIMTGSYSIGEHTVSPSHFTRSSLGVHRSHTFSLMHYPFPSLLFKGCPRFPRADGRQNGDGFRRRVVFWGYVRRLLHHIFACANWWWTTTEQFEDEIHPRLRFAHRGLVAMANNGAKNSNDSQFFITLGAYYPYFMCSRSSYCTFLGMM